MKENLSATGTLRTNRRAAAKGFAVCELILDNPAALNALTPAMARDAIGILREWQKDDSVAAIVLRGEGGRAFCAGGDVRFARQCIVGGDFAAADSYFMDEYVLDYFLHRFNKPLVCWGGGVLMGGGMGLFQGCDARIVLPNTKAAMPECKIGFFPDVGAAFFMEQFRNAPHLGYYLGLTGKMFDGFFAASANAADFLFAEDSYDAMLSALCKIHWNEFANAADAKAAMNDAMQKLQLQKEIPKRDDSELFRIAEQCFVAAQKGGADAAIAALPEDDRKIANAASPLSARVWTGYYLYPNHRAAAKEERDSDSARTRLRNVFAADYILARNFLRRGDFAEGVRALLIDKDRAPNWRAPADSDSVLAMFQTPDFELDKEFIRRMGEAEFV